MINLFKSKDTIQKENGKKRSSKWPAFRKKFLLNKICAVCGGTAKLEAHHLKPFHLHPELELCADNLIPLCENKKDGVNCHLFIGHLGCFKAINPDCETDSLDWYNKIKGRV